MKILDTGKYTEAKGINKCDCCIGLDPNSKQPHLIKCENWAKFVWYARLYLVEIIRNSKNPIYDNLGARVCKECFEKLKTKGPPSDLEELRAKHIKNSIELNQP